MFILLKTEIQKLKRYKVLYAGILLMLLSVIITMITSTAKDGTVWDFRMLYEQVIQNNMTTIFPMTITLIVGFIINREIRDNTLKNLKTVPVKYSKILLSKILLGCILSIIYGLCSWIFTLLAFKLSSFGGLTLQLLIKSLWQITLFNLFLYIGITPLIAITNKIGINHLISVIFAFVYGYSAMFVTNNELLLNIYPVTAGLSIIGYRKHVPVVKEMLNPELSIISLIIILFISLFIISTIKQDKNIVKNDKSELKQHKKGW